MRMLFPEPAAAVDPRTVYADVPHNDRRPSVRLNMVVSVDGGTSWNGVSGGLSGSADKTLFAVLRSLADIVLVASGTMRAEHYRPAVLESTIQDTRVGQGQTPVPKIAVVLRTCRLDWHSPFFTAAAERPVVITVSSAPEAERSRAAEVAEVIVAGEDDVDLRQAIAELGSRGAKSVLVEGGPTLNGELAQASLLDELCVTLTVTCWRRRETDHGIGPRQTRAAGPVFDLRRGQLCVPTLSAAVVFAPRPSAQP